MLQRRTAFSENVIEFCRFLRGNGFVIGPEEEATALRALAFVPFDDRIFFQDCLRATLVRSVQQLEKFNQLFEQYWKELEKALDSKIKDDPKRKRPNKTPQPSFDSLKSWLYGKKNEEETETASYSAEEILSKKDFSTIPADDLDEVMQRIKELSKTLANRVNRRHQKSRSADAFDLKQTLRKNLRRGGELIEIAYQKPKKNRLKLVVLCDVSKSMDLYSAFLMQFIYAFQTVYRRIETFVFGTSLHRITNELKQQTFDNALTQLSETVTGWSGGTQIGNSLYTFVKNYADRFLDRHTVVIILSDGWDTGDIEVLEEAMSQIHRKARKVLWLNPLAGSSTFEPTVQGMKTAMPYIDTFAAVHNVESLRMVSKWL